MKYVYNFAVLTLLVILQGTLFPVLIPWLNITPAFVFLTLLSFRFSRTYLLTAALWAGLVQDLLMGEVLGLFMLTNFIAMAIAWELKEDFLDNRVLTVGLRIAVATLIQEVILGFSFYIRGLDSKSLLAVLQLSAGTNLLSNLILYILLLGWLRLRGSDKIEAALEAIE